MAESVREWGVRIHWDGQDVRVFPYAEGGSKYNAASARRDLPLWNPGANAVVVSRTVTVSDWEEQERGNNRPEES